MRYPFRGGYTLVEMLVALAVGMAVMQVAFASFFFIQKFVQKIDRLDAMNQVAQAAVLWTIGKPTKTVDFQRSNSIADAQLGVIGVPQDAAAKPFNPPIGVFLTPAKDRCTFTLRDWKRKKDLEMQGNFITYDYDRFLAVAVMPESMP